MRCGLLRSRLSRIGKRGEKTIFTSVEGAASKAEDGGEVRVRHRGLGCRRGVWVAATEARDADGGAGSATEAQDSDEVRHCKRGAAVRDAGECSSATNKAWDADGCGTLPVRWRMAAGCERRQLVKRRMAAGVRWG